MNTNGINVFHTTDGNCIVFGVAHNFEFDFLITLYALFNQHLMYRRQLKSIQSDFNQFFFVISKTTAGATQSEGGTQDNRIADSISSILCFLNRIGDFRRDRGFTDRLAQLFKHLTVLSPFNGCAACAKKLYITLTKNTLFL